VIAPEGAEVRLVAMTAESRVLMASKKRILNECELERANSYLMKPTGNCQNMFRVSSGRQVIKADTRMPRELIIPAIYRSEEKATIFNGH